MKAHPSLLALLGLALALAGCAATGAASKLTFSSTELGLGYYLPEASLVVTQKGADEYLANFHGGRQNFSPSQIDGLMATALEVLVIHCPAWRIASAQGAKSVMVQSLPASLATGDDQYLIRLSPKEVSPGGQRDSEGRLFIDFSHKDWQYVQKDLCARSHQFNSKGLVR